MGIETITEVDWDCPLFYRFYSDKLTTKTPNSNPDPYLKAQAQELCVFHNKQKNSHKFSLSPDNRHIQNSKGIGLKLQFSKRSERMSKAKHLCFGWFDTNGTNNNLIEISTRFSKYAMWLMSIWLKCNSFYMIYILMEFSVVGWNSPFTFFSIFRNRFPSRLFRLL